MYLNKVISLSLSNIDHCHYTWLSDSTITITTMLDGIRVLCITLPSSLLT